MGTLARLRERLGLGSGPDFWAVCRMDWHGHGGFYKFSDDWGRLDDPVGKDTFEWNAGNLDPGKYRLMAWKDGRIRRPEDFGVEQWTLEIGDPNDTTSAEIERVDPDAIADAAAERVVDALQPDEGLTPEERVARERANLQLALLTNAEFVARHGEQIALAEFGVGGTDGLGATEYEQSPLGALLYDALQNPEQLRAVGSHLGAGGGAFMDGLTSGVEADGDVPGEETDTADGGPKAAGGEGKRWESRVDGITSLEDLVDREDHRRAGAMAATLGDDPEDHDERDDRAERPDAGG